MKSEILRVAATLERASEHPLAAAILAAATERKMESGDLADFFYRTGKGITGVVERPKSGAWQSRSVFRAFYFRVRSGKSRRLS